MKRVAGALALAAAMMWGASPVWAECEKCAMEKSRSAWQDQDESKCPVTSKALEKAKFLIKNADEIGLTEEQVQTIKAIKLDLKKASVRQEAEMEVFELEVKAKMSEPKLDVEGLNAMLDTAGQGFATGAKSVVAQYAKIKGLLSEPQAAKAKEIWKKQEGWKKTQ